MKLLVLFYCPVICLPVVLTKSLHYFKRQWSQLTFHAKILFLYLLMQTVTGETKPSNHLTYLRSVNTNSFIHVEENGAVHANMRCLQGAQHIIQILEQPTSNMSKRVTFSLYVPDVNRFICFNKNWRLVGMNETEKRFGGSRCHFHDKMTLETLGNFLIVSSLDEKKQIGFNKKGRPVKLDRTDFTDKDLNSPRFQLFYCKGQCVDNFINTKCQPNHGHIHTSKINQKPNKKFNAHSNIKTNANGGTKLIPIPTAVADRVSTKGGVRPQHRKRHYKKPNNNNNNNNNKNKNVNVINTNTNINNNNNNVNNNNNNNNNYKHMQPNINNNHNHLHYNHHPHHEQQQQHSHYSQDSVFSYENNMINDSASQPLSSSLALSSTVTTNGQRRRPKSHRKTKMPRLRHSQSRHTENIHRERADNNLSRTQQSNDFES